MLILDLKNDHIYPKIGRIAKIEEDSSEVQRYFSVEYKQKKRAFLTVRRPAQSLCIILTKNEPDSIIDSISFLEESDLKVHKKKKKIAVQSMDAESEIVDF